MSLIPRIRYGRYDMKEFQDLLKDIDEGNSNERFKEIASKLMNEYVILIDGKEFFMTELEFYYHSEKHPDPYVHKDEAQLNFGAFYVHKKNGNRGGIDLTFGSKEEGVFCGVLLRGIKDKKGVFFTGPNTIKNKVFCKNLNVGNYEDLQDIIDKCERVKLENSIEKNEQIYHSTRVGLKPTFQDYNEHSGKYIYKLHRFIAFNEKNHGYKERRNVKGYNL